MKIIDENTSNFEELNQRFSIVVLSQKIFPKIVRWSMNVFFEYFLRTLQFLISAAAEIKTVSTRGLGCLDFWERMGPASMPEVIVFEAHTGQWERAEVDIQKSKHQNLNMARARQIKIL